MPKGCFKHKPLTEETRKKIGLANKGRVFSDEWRKNLSIAHRGQVSWRKGKTFVDKKKQNNKCPICHRGIKKNLSVDHNHSTKKIRGLICNNCNLSIGNANDSPKI